MRFDEDLARDLQIQVVDRIVRDVRLVDRTGGAAKTECGAEPNGLRTGNDWRQEGGQADNRHGPGGSNHQRNPLQRNQDSRSYADYRKMGEAPIG